VGAPAPPRAVKKFFRPNLQEKCVTAPPRTRSAPKPVFLEICRTVFAGWLRFGGIVRWPLRATTKKVVNFFGQKSAPPDKILATPIVENALSYSV